MTLQIYRLRRLLGVTAILLTLVVAGMYFYARWRATSVLSRIPGKIGIEIKQTAKGFQFSKSDGKRTLFTIQASDLKQFKLDGRAELHNVSIVLYGRDSTRFDQIYGDDFAYDPKTGDVTAKGDVHIDLVANPAGLASPDQSTPKELKNPIHLKTRDLVFNKDTGDASTDNRVEFQTPQATGWAVGVKYAGKANVLTLSSQVHVTVSGANAAVIEAERGQISGEPRAITLERSRLDREGAQLQADQAVFYLDADNNVQRVLATGNIRSDTWTVPRPGDKKARLANTSPAHEREGEIHSTADQAEVLMTDEGNLLRTANLSGRVHFEQVGTDPMQGDAGRVIMEFAGQNQLEKVHALEGAHLVQNAASREKTAKKTDSGPQNFDLRAPVIDFTVSQGHVLERAATQGAAAITITPAEANADTGSNPATQRTVVTAGSFDAKFSESPVGGVARNRLTSIHGTPEAKIVSSAPGEPDRISTSESVDAVFLPVGGIGSVVQQGNVAYDDGQAPDKRTKAFADRARYTPADQMLVLTGNPRVTNGSMATTATTIRMNRASGEATAEGNVKSTYSDLKEQPDGALLASASPIHVTARTMTAQSSSGLAVYTGTA